MADSRIQDLIRAIEQADSPARLIAAVRALAAAHGESGIPTLIQVLGYNNPAAAVAAVEGLVQMGDVAVQPLLEQLDGYNYGARAYAVRALAAIGDPRALAVLLVAAETDFAPSVRRAATKGLGSIQWQRAASPPEAQENALQTLLRVSHDPDWTLRYAAIVGLQALAAAVDRGQLRSIQSQLDHLAQADPDAATRARARLAQQHLQAVRADLVAAGEPPCEPG